VKATEGGENARSAQQLRDALQKEADVWEPYRLVLEKGVDFIPSVRPSDVEPGEKHFCFRNALRLALATSNLTYFEGVVIFRGFEGMLEHHAWCADESGRVVDPTPTWADKQSQLPLILRGVAIPVTLAIPYVEIETPSRGVLNALGRPESPAEARLAGAFFVSDDPSTFSVG
jgi:hypothetical protein